MSKPINVDTWSDRPKSMLVKELMQYTGYSAAEFANILGYSLTYFNNKLSRNSFSFEDLIFLFYASDIKISLTDKKNQSVWKTISLEEWFPEDAKQVDNVKKEYHEKIYEKKRKEYEKLKNELDSMKELYGF